jgi:hypothetical protein
MLRCLSRLADARVDDVDDGVEDVLQRMGVAMLDDVAVRYASAGDNIARNGCWGVGAKLNGILHENEPQRQYMRERRHIQWKGGTGWL